MPPLLVVRPPRVNARKTSSGVWEKAAASVKLPVRYRKEVATLLMLVAVATEFVGVSIGLPVLVQYAASFGVNSSNVGTIFSVGAFAAVLSNFWLPSVSDRTGRKSIIVLSLVWSAVSYVLQSAAPTFEILLLAVFLGRIFGSTQPIAVAYISDIFSPLQRPRLIGMVPACASACFIIGPTLGGILYAMSESFRVPLAFAAALVTVMLPIVVVFLPDSKALISKEEKDFLNKAQEEHHRKMRKTIFAAHEVPFRHLATMVEEEEGEGFEDVSPTEGSPLKTHSFGSGFDQKEICYPGPLWDWRCHVCFWSQFFNTVAFSAFTTCIPLILEDPVFRLGGEGEGKDAVLYTGYVIGCGAAVKSIGLIVIFDKVQRRIGLPQTMVLGAALSFLAFFILSVQTSILGIAVGFAFFALGTSMLQPGIFSYVTVIAPIDFTARAIAMPNAAVSFGEMLAPISSTKLLAAKGERILFLVITAMLFIQVLITVSLLLRSNLSTKGEEEVPLEETEMGLELPAADIEHWLSSHFIETLRRRNYKIEDPKTQKAVLELISRSFPFLQAKEEGNQSDVNRLIHELAIPSTDAKGTTASGASRGSNKSRERLAIASSIVVGDLLPEYRLARPKLDRRLQMGAGSRVLGSTF